MPNNEIELPPTIVGRVRDRRRNRTRIRMEVSSDQARWLITLIQAGIKDLDIDSDGFRPAYLLQQSLQDQLDRRKR